MQSTAVLLVSVVRPRQDSVHSFVRERNGASWYRRGIRAHQDAEEAEQGFRISGEDGGRARAGKVIAEEDGGNKRPEHTAVYTGGLCKGSGTRINDQATVSHAPDAAEVTGSPVTKRCHVHIAEEGVNDPAVCRTTRRR